MSTDTAEQERLFDIAQVAERLGVPSSWVRDRVTERAITHRRIGKHVRFTEADVELLIEQAKVDPRGGDA